ncbi:MAG: terminase TerL endonuclease subunit, partial [Chitinophagaceae bacterium]
GYELWSRSKAVFDKQSEDKYRLVFMKPLADDANWEDEQVWKFANPSLGIGTSLDFLRRKYNECLQMPAKIPHFKAYFLNIWSDSESLWIDDKAWSESGHAGGQFTDDQLAGRSCYGGLDVASTSDLSSWVLLFPGTPDDPAADGYTVLVRTWGTASSVERRDDHFKDKLKYWAKDGWIDLSAETRISHEAIKEQIKADSEKFNIILAGYDKWNSHGIEEDVSKTGITMIDVIQSTKVLDQSRKEMHLLVKEKKLYHGFNPVLAWNVSNVVATVNNLDQVEIVKGKSKDKIDAVAATINAVYVSAYKPEDKRARTMFIPMRGDRT